jgi:hypothetical protein
VFGADPAFWLRICIVKERRTGRSAEDHDHQHGEEERWTTETRLVAPRVKKLKGELKAAKTTAEIQETQK